MNKSIIDTINEEMMELYAAGIIDADTLREFYTEDLLHLEASWSRPFGKDVPK